MGDLDIGAVFAGHRIDAIAGRGGMGVVYRAHDLLLDRTRALKVISGDLADDEQYRVRFRREVRLAAAIEHPHIVPIYHAGQEGGVLYIVMRYVEGTDLEGVLRSEGRLQPDRALAVLSQAAAALDAAHARGLVHRDVKPPNFLLARSGGTPADATSGEPETGEAEHVYLTDFGFARLAASSSHQTVSGAFVGTFQYAAPEQLRSEPVTKLADIYALACVAFETLTGQRPYPHEELAAVVAGHLFTDPPLAHEVSPVVPEAVGGVLRRGLAKEPGERWPSAGELCRALEAALGGRASTPGPTPRRPVAVAPGDGPSARVQTRDGRMPQALGGTPHGRRRLVGREPERRHLRRALADAADGRPTLTVIVAEAGIGKSRLVRDLADHARAEGMVVLWGECVPLASEDFPYAPIASALRGVEASRLQAALSALDPRGRRALANVFPDIVRRPDQETAGEPPDHQARLFAWILALVRAITTDGCTLLVVEDIHWADPSTRDFLQFLVRDVHAERLAVVATVRSDEPHGDAGVRRLVVDLGRNERTTRLDLAPLTRKDVGQMLAALMDRAPSRDLADAVFARAEGNPFYTEALVTAGRIDDGVLPPTVRDALLVAMDDLSAAAREVLRASAVIGRPTEHELIRDALGLDQNVLLSALRETVDRRVMVSDRDSGLLRFRHALLREVVLQELNAADLDVLHRAIAEALELTSRPGGRSSNPAELARHWDAAGEPVLALRAYFRAGLANSAVSAYSEALRHFERALELWPRGQADQGAFEFDRVDILSNAAEAARWTGNFERAQELCGAALEIVDESAEPGRAAALYERLGRYQPWNVPASRAAYARALELLPDEATTERARLLTDDALALSWAWRWREARARAMTALQIAAEVGSPAQEGSARAVVGVATANLGDPHAGERELRRACESVQVSGLEALATVQLDLADVLRLQGRTREALSMMLDGERLTSTHGADAYASFMAVSAADDLLSLGRWEEADGTLGAVAESQLSLTGRLLLAIVRGRLATGRGELDAAGDALDRAAALVSDDSSLSFLVVLHGAVAELELARAHPEDALAAITRGLEAIGDREDVLYTPGLFSLGVRTEADLAELGGRRGERGDRGEGLRRAQSLIVRLNRLAARASEPGAALHVVDAHLALSEAEMSRFKGQASPELWMTAARRHEALDHHPVFAYAKLREAEMRLRSDQDPTRGADALRSAHSTAVSIGAQPIARRAEALAEGSGIDLPTGAPAPEPAA